MRTAVTIIRSHDADFFRVLTGPEVPVAEQVAAFKALSAQREHPAIAEMEIWTSDAGRTKRTRFHAPAAKAAKAAPAAKAKPNPSPAPAKN